MPVDRYASYGFKRQRESDVRRWGRWALALFYALGGIAHFVFTDAMAAIVPPAIPRVPRRHPSRGADPTESCMR